ncbi:hypothetical protein Tco_1052386 [Tanacetum coccineum]
MHANSHHRPLPCRDCCAAKKRPRASTVCLSKTQKTRRLGVSDIPCITIIYAFVNIVAEDKETKTMSITTHCCSVSWAAKGKKEKEVKHVLYIYTYDGSCGEKENTTTVIGIRAVSYRELGCISNMSNSDELRHTDNTTLVPPRLLDTLLQVYHRRRPTLGLLTLPSVSPFPPTIRRTARISVLPIEPNLAERARIYAINLIDYQLDPLTPPPSPPSLFSMAAYQRMIAEMDPTQREEALTAYGTETGQNSVPEIALTVCTTCLRGQLHTILEDMDHYPNACLVELEAFMTLWDVKPRVEENLLETLSVDELITQLRQVCEDAEDRASNAQEEA